MMMEVKEYMISAIDSKKSKTGRAFSPAKIIAIPKKTEKTMICKTFPETKEAKGFVGINDKRISPIEGVSMTVI